MQKAGQKKLKTMEHAAVFRRKIIFKEWEHKMMRLKIEEKIEQIRLIEKTKVFYLKNIFMLFTHTYVNLDNKRSPNVVKV